ncbi:pantoate--beta-alanine ligase [Verrucomicrobiaceae bacterium N1E253]|uniref:Pantothenate synthetase n=1 Tax=Oceaniferula marina TaxID=2748318 RepID=A0A851GH51_9BACT|nr:pantoate--beta-alanine ligase [Oceaniferula marina]NWK54575.1 pantoate--beta-alanine ligase [Oceaniferula marina]
MLCIHTPDKLAASLDLQPTPRILVPTMGALHDGHLTLVKRARELAGPTGSVILTLFVNPTQFNNPKDLDKYPRSLERDLELCKQHGVDLVFAPESGAMYYQDHSVNISESSLTQRLCGATRPGHFDGVCTVVMKLFNLCRADAAVFGKKDYQQLAVIRRMVRDLNIPITIEGVDTVREPDGLAMSSRNTRLTTDQRSDAPRIRKALLAARDAFLHGSSQVQALLELTRAEIEASPENKRIDYLELLDAESLQPIEEVTRPAVMATAVFYGDVRLIDNIEMLP